MNTDNLKSLVDNLFLEIRNVNDYAEKVSGESKANVEFDVRLREREKKLDDRQTKLDDMEKQLKAQEESIDKKLDEIKDKETVISRLEDKKNEIRDLAVELEGKRDEVTKKLRELEEKIKSYDFLTEKEKEIEHREALMAKETLLDRERKEKLDVREENLKKESARLQNIASSMGLKS